MNLQETIADLEKQAAQYTQAANTLRGLLGQGGGQSRASGQSAGGRKAAGKGGAAKGGARKKRQGARKAVSPETRARISQALKASHAARKAQPQQ